MDTRFCMQCGSKVNIDDRFCTFCGAEMCTSDVIYCNACGASNSDDVSFCEICGAKLAKHDTSIQIKKPNEALRIETKYNSNKQKKIDAKSKETPLNDFEDVPVKGENRDSTIPQKKSVPMKVLVAVCLMLSLIALSIGLGVYLDERRAIAQPETKIEQQNTLPQSSKETQTEESNEVNMSEKRSEEQPAQQKSETEPETTDPEELVLQPSRPVTEEKPEETTVAQVSEEPKEPPVTLSETLSAPMSCNVFQPMDLDSDGISEYIKIEFVQNSNGGFTCSVAGKETADGRVSTYSFDVANMEPYPAQEFYFVNLDNSDSCVDIAVSYFLTGVKGCYFTRFLRFQNGEFQNLGEVEGMIRASQSYSLPEIQFYGDGTIRTVQHCMVMQTWFLEASYQLQNGKLELIPQMYYSAVFSNGGSDVGSIVTTRCELMFGHADDTNALFSLPGGTTLEVLGCDGQSKVWFWCPYIEEIVVGHFFNADGDRFSGENFYSFSYETGKTELVFLPFDNLMMFG